MNPALRSQSCGMAALVNDSTQPKETDHGQEESWPEENDDAQRSTRRTNSRHRASLAGRLLLEGEGRVNRYSDDACRMVKPCGCESYTREQAKAIIERLWAREPMAAIAAETGLSEHCIRGWDCQWEHRGGKWKDQPLTDEEIAAGFRLAHWYGNDDQVLGTHVMKPPGTVRPPTERLKRVNTFLLKMRKNRSEDLEGVQTAYSAMADEDKARLTPAYDAFVRAMEHAAELNRLRDLAIDLALNELVAMKLRGKPKADAHQQETRAS